MTVVVSSSLQNWQTKNWKLYGKFHSDLVWELNWAIIYIGLSECDKYVEFNVIEDVNWLYFAH